MEIRFTAQRSGNGYTGTVVVPLTDGTFARAVAKSKSQPDAMLAAASSIADKISGNPALMALLPPGAGVALNAATALGRAAQSGKLKETLSKYAGPAVKRLAKVFGF